MRILGRIAYAFLMAVLLLFVVSYVQAIREDMYYSEKITEALETEDYLFFYSSVPDYNQLDAVYSNRGEEINVEFFALAVVEKTSPLVVKEKLYIIIHNKNTYLPADVKISFMDGEIATTYTMTYFREFTNVMVAINENSEVYIPVSTFDRFVIKNGDTVLLEDDILTSELDIYVGEEVINFYNENSKMPTDRDLADVRIMPINEHILVGTQYVLWIGLSIYAIILVVTTYFTFFFQRKKLGKEPLPDALKKDIDALKPNDKK